MHLMFCVIVNFDFKNQTSLAFQTDLIIFTMISCGRNLGSFVIIILQLLCTILRNSKL